MKQFRSWILCGLVLSACGATPDPAVPPVETDAGVEEDAGTDAGDEADAGEVDAGEGDAGMELDAGPPPSSPVRINEVYVDRNFSGDRVEYVELSGPVGEPLGALSLRLIGRDGQILEDVRVTTSDAGIHASGTWVVGAASASGRVDQTYSLANWGLDNDQGAVQLVKDGALPELIDVLGYGPAATPSPGDPPSATSEGSPAALPSAVDNSLGRRAGAVDTNDNSADFCIQASSGGAANGDCL